MRDEKHNSIRSATALFLKAKARLLLAKARHIEARTKEEAPQDIKDGLENAMCINIGPGTDNTTELTVYAPKEQTITISNNELTFIINALIEREALIRCGR